MAVVVAPCAARPGPGRGRVYLDRGSTLARVGDGHGSAIAALRCQARGSEVFGRVFDEPHGHLDAAGRVAEDEPVLRRSGGLLGVDVLRPSPGRGHAELDAKGIAPAP